MTDLNIYVPDDLELIFIEIIYPQSCSVTVKSLYKHPSIAINGYTNEILSPIFLMVSIQTRDKNSMVFLKIQF